MNTREPRGDQYILLVHYEAAQGAEIVGRYYHESLQSVEDAIEQMKLDKQVRISYLIAKIIQVSMGCGYCGANIVNSSSSEHCSEHEWVDKNSAP